MNGITESVIKAIADNYANAFSLLNATANAMQDIFTGKTGSDLDSGASIVGQVSSQIINVSANAAKSTTAIGFAIALAFFVIALLELSTTERLTLEYFIKFFSKLVISVFAVAVSGDLISQIYDFGAALSEVFADSSIWSLGTDTAGMDAFSQEAIEKLLIDAIGDSSAGLAIAFKLLFSSLINYLPVGIACLLLVIVTYLIAFTRILELGVRGAFMPIALGLIADDGWRGAGGRYVRKYIAVCAQGAVLIAISMLLKSGMAIAFNSGFAKAAATNNAAADIFLTTHALNALLLVLVGLSAAAISMMFKSISIVNDAFGG